LLGLLSDQGIEQPTGAEAVSALTPWATGFRYDDPPERGLNREEVHALVDAVRRWAEGAGPTAS
jgi:hypothetical protein